MSDGPTFARIDTDNNVGTENNNNNDNNNEDNDDNDTDFDPWVTGTIAGGGDGNVTDAQIEAWRERERRSRTVRSLMMFLLMLMLMDGEEQSQQQRRQRQQQNNAGGLRGDGGKDKMGREGVSHNGDNVIFSDMDLYSARRIQDRSVEDVVVNGNHPRVNELIERNDGRNVDGEVRAWALQQRSIRTRMFYEHLFKDLVLEQSDGSFVKVLVASPPSNIKLNKAVSTLDVTAAISPEESGKIVQNDLQSAIHTFDEVEEAEQEVWHYPWNATGFYRGDWMAFDDRSSSTTAEMNDSASELLSSIKPRIPLTSSSTNSSSKVVKKLTLTPVEAEIPLLDFLKDQPDPIIGIYLLPPEIELKYLNNGTVSANNNTEDVSSASPKRRRTGDNSAGNGNDNVNDAPFSLRGSSTTTTTTTEKLPEKISLTKSSGKAALQLYSKSVPAMKELSLIEGVVKLYDSNTVGYSTRRDILLRVHGVLIHSLGRISLVANPKSIGRTALVISDHSNHDSNTKTQNAKETTTVKNSEINDVSSVENNRRRLQELLSTTTSYDDKRMDEIRDRALNLFYNNIDHDHTDIPSYKQLWSMTDEATTAQDNGASGNGNDVNSWVPDIRKEYFSSFQLLNKEENAEDDSHIIMEERQKYRRRLEEVSGMNDSTKEFTVANETFVGDTTAENLNHLNDNVTNKNISKQGGHDDTHIDFNKTTSEAYSKVVIPFPYARDDEDKSLQRQHMPAFVKSMSAREKYLEANAGSCEFVMNMNVQEEQWTVGQWRKLISKHMEHEVTDPSLAAHISGNPTTVSDEARSQEDGHKKKISSKKFQQRAGMEQAWVMILNGTIISPNCNFAANINASAIRTDWEVTTGKAINYSFYMMTICLTQIVLLLRQLLHTQAQSVATRVSLLCIGWQTVVDALLCLVHIYLSLAMQPLFTAFASVAFFKLLIFCVIEMKYMAIIIQARNASNGGNTIELLRRQIAMLHLRFYVALMGSCLGFFYSGDSYRTPYMLVLYSFWVPQIIHNVVTEAKKPLHPYYIYGMSVTRLFAPIYIFAIQGNFLKEVYPESATDIFMCQLLSLWVGIQALILDAQGRYGARFMIPTQFLPPKYDYSRPIPASLLSSCNETENPSEQLQKEREIPKTEVCSLVVTKRDTSPRDGGARNRKEGNKINRPETMTTETVMALPKNPSTCIDCVICYNEIDTTNRTAYMLSPCDHIFHKDCLVQWMEVKMECPICRTQLPVL
mmetsp:Transcript_738/g.810  ORF Transcript_738/g.810 Transcript_738/m.810 type:complete len:1236 (+) Transcript_738:144-3851(+)